MDDGAAKLLASATPGVLAGAYARLAGMTDWSTATLEEQVRALADEFGLKLGQAAQPLRAAVTGSSQSPGLFDVMETLGRDETLGRIDDVITGRAG
jgi:glutamyl-tRNA synthetase